MNAQDRNISTVLPKIARLDEVAINRIAAGEVVERPASAVKELVENAIDAGARRIEVAYADGGRTLIRVTDDGHGMTADDLPLAVTRHATSKIDGSDLLNIHSFGFRGEALPSLGAVGRLRITSRVAGQEGAEILVDGGRQEGPVPAAGAQGTRVDLRDLFHATPARLKFLRSDRAEAQAIADVVRRLAMAEPSIGFTLTDLSGGGTGRVLLRLDPEQGDLFDGLQRRLTAILGREFTDNSLAIDATREDHRLTGYAALPTYSRGAAVSQYVFVNGRPVRDKSLTGALRAAYNDLLPRDRHPAAVLFIDCPPRRVDVNVHPAKAEVRFRDPGLVRGLIVSALRHALAEHGNRAATTISAATLGAFRPEPQPEMRPAAPVYQMPHQMPLSRPSASARNAGYAMQQPMAQPGFAEAPGLDILAPSARVETPVVDPEAEARPLGAARAQIHETYIIAQTEDGIVIVDQHAAHERLVYERLKAQMAENGVTAQALLIPDIVELGQGAQLVLDAAEDLARLGLSIEPFGPGTVAVRETPAMLGTPDCQRLLRDIADALEDGEEGGVLRGRLDAVMSRMACHGSVRSGRRMPAEEMNALLREMEATPHSGQCNHGRPTYVELRLSDIERLFGRT
ncbi:MAG: DNA mismatch repair endonuclease MutL [Qingshengfaniella sp.]